MGRYIYRAWHTNLPMTPAGVWHFYDGRAGMERRIREIRADYALRNIPTHAFEANALYLEIIRLAYNLVTAFQRTCLPQEWQTLTLSKLRHRLFWLPGELTRPQHRPTLRLANVSQLSHCEPFAARLRWRPRRRLRGQNCKTVADCNACSPKSQFWQPNGGHHQRSAKVNPDQHR